MVVREKCPGCGAKIGKLHGESCDWEECPFCHGQLYGCGCYYDELGIDFEEYDELTAEQEKEWEKLLREKGRIPYGSETNR